MTMNPYELFKNREFALCAKDPIYFIESYVKMQHPNKGITSFKLYDYQKDLIELYTFGNRVISKMPRQSGKTLCAVGAMLWKMIFQPNSTILIASVNMTAAMEILQRIQVACEFLPDFFNANIRSCNKSMIEFTNGSRVWGRQVSTQPSHAHSVSMIYFDEFAFVERNAAEYAWVATMPAVEPNGTCIIASTPFDVNNIYMKIWESACRGDNGFTTYEVDWRDVPRSVTPAQFERQMRATIGDEMWKREFECEVS